MRQTDGSIRMRILVLPLLCAMGLFGAVEGTVQNQTSGKPQAGDTVTLIELGSGMNTIGSARTDAQGRFSLNTDLKPGTPYLLQGLHQGVTYNRMLPPGSPSTGISVDVYDAAPKVPSAKVSQDMIL